MTEWNKNAQILANNDPVYQKFLQKLGATKIDHYGIVRFGDPRSEEFLRELSGKRQRIFGIGDSLSKIAHEYYGDARLWWLLAWFNAKPTDFHCKVGDIIEIPFPLEEVMLHAYNREVQ